MLVLSFLFFFIQMASADDTVVTIRHVEPDPNQEGIGVIVSVEDSKGNPKDFCSGDDCKDRFEVSIASGKRIKNKIHEVIPFTDYKEEGYATLILIDRSGSMGPYWDSVKKAANSYINGMQEKDSAAIYTFNENVDSLGSTINWESSKSTLKSRISKMPSPSGGTNLYKSLRDVLSLVKNKNKPKFRTIVILTDAIDASAEGFGMYETIIRWSRDSKVPINVVGFIPDSNADQENLRRLENLAVDTKGRFAQVNNDKQIAKEFENIQKRVHQTWIVKLAVCNFPAGWHDYRVVAKDSTGETMGLDSTIYPIEKDIVGGVAYCGIIDPKTGIKEPTYITTNDWPFFLLALLLVGGGALGVGVMQNRKNKVSRDGLRRDFEGMKNQVNDLANKPDVSTDVQSLQAELAQLRAQLIEVSSRPQPTPITQVVQQPAPEKPKAKGTQMFIGACLYDTSSHQMYELGRLADGTVMSVGSDASRSQLVLSIDTISGHHANIYFQNGQYYIEDNNSTNGTLVNHQNIKGYGAVLIENNTLIQLGNQMFSFVV